MSATYAEDVRPLPGRFITIPPSAAEYLKLFRILSGKPSANALNASSLISVPSTAALTVSVPGDSASVCIPRQEARKAKLQYLTMLLKLLQSHFEQQII